MNAKKINNKLIHFANWIRNSKWEPRKHVGWINHSWAISNSTFLSDKQLYELYLKENKIDDKDDDEC